MTTPHDLVEIEDLDKIIVASAEQIVSAWIHNGDQRKFARASIQLRLKQFASTVLVKVDPAAFAAMIKEVDNVTDKAKILIAEIVEKEGIVALDGFECEKTQALAVALGIKFPKIVAGADGEPTLAEVPKPELTAAIGADADGFCKACGASDEHKEGQGRCEKCQHFDDEYVLRGDGTDGPELPAKSSTDGQRNSEIGVNPVRHAQDEATAGSPPLLDVSTDPEK